MAEMDMQDTSILPERISFKAYASILYLEPRMKIYVQGKKIRTKRLACTLYKPKMYKFSSTRFKKKSEEEVAKAEQNYQNAEEQAREAESVSRDLERKISTKAKPKKDEMVALRVAQDEASGLRKLAIAKREEHSCKLKSLKEKKTLDFVFGFNIVNRKYYGMFVYNCSRLIRMYERVGPQLNGGVNCAGIIGVVNVPYLVLEPTHNKQHFADNKEYRHLLKAMGDHLQCYWRDSKVTAGKGVLGFWDNFGYSGDEWTDMPSTDPKYERARAMHIPKVIQCDGCLKWRTLPFQQHMVGQEPPDKWICAMNPDTKHNKCQCPEEVPQIPEGEFRAERKTDEQRKQEITDKMEKMKKELSKVSTKPSASIREATTSNFEPPSSSREQRSRRSPARRRSYATLPSSSDDDEPVVSERRNVTQDSRMSSTSVGFKRRNVENERRVVKKSPEVREKKASSRPVVPIKKSKRTTIKTNHMESDQEEDEDDEEQDDDAEPMVGRQVEVDVSGKWRPGRVVSMKRKPTRYRIKFDQHPQDRFDKWIEKGNPELRFVSNSDLGGGGVTTNGATNATSGLTSPNKARRSSVPEIEKDNVELSMDSNTLENYDNALGKLRTCLRYFLPPQWKMPKEEINGLSLEQLVEFPMDDFFDHYEKGLRRLVSNFRTQADQNKASADALRIELTETQQLLFEVLSKFDKETPEMTHDDVAPYARKYLEDATTG